MDKFSPSKRSWIMSLVRSKGNLATELRLIELFRKNRVKGWRRKSRMFGKPDFIFPFSRVAVFVDGEFWHGHPTRCVFPSNNAAFWIAKIQKNVRRDKLVNKTLKAEGWTVVRIWQHELKTSAAIKKLKRANLL